MLMTIAPARDGPETEATKATDQIGNQAQPISNPLHRLVRSASGPGHRVAALHAWRIRLGA